MGAYWGFRCQKHDIDSEAWTQHSADALTAFAKVWRHINALRQLTDDLVSCGVSIEFYARYFGYEDDILEFLEDHSYCDLAIINSYDETQPIIFEQDLAPEEADQQKLPPKNNLVRVTTREHREH